MSDRAAPPARILHIDDDPDVLRAVREYLSDEEIPDWGRPEIVSSSDFATGLSTLEEQRFDVVVLDVRLGAHGQEDVRVEDEAGVRALQEIQRRRFVPVVFYTGLPGIVRDMEQPVVLAVEKTEKVPALFDALCRVFATGLPAVNRALLRLVEEVQRRYMWDFVVPRWAELSVMEDHAAIAYLLARRLGRALSGPGLQQMADHLEGLEGTLPDGKTIHAIEMYVMPPLKEQEAQVGDLFHGAINETDGWWFLLTPSCDLAHEKADFVILAAACPLDEHEDMAALREASNRKERDKTAKAVEALVGQATGGQRDRWIYLPAALDVPDLVVDFQRLVSISRSDLEGLNRIASLDSPFAEAAVSRFGRYFGRVGTPDLDARAIVKRLREQAASGGDG